MQWQEGECTANGIRLHYRRTGLGSPVMLLHGVTDHAVMMGVRRWYMVL